MKQNLSQPAVIAVIVLLVLAVGVFAYTQLKGPPSKSSPAIDAQIKAMGTDPTLMGKGGDPNAKQDLAPPGSKVPAPGH